MSNDNTKLMTVADVARRLNVSQRSIRRWAADGHLPAVKVGKLYRFTASVVERARTCGLTVHAN